MSLRSGHGCPRGCFFPQGIRGKVWSPGFQAVGGVWGRDTDIEGWRWEADKHPPGPPTASLTPSYTRESPGPSASRVEVGWFGTWLATCVHTPALGPCPRPDCRPWLGSEAPRWHVTCVGPPTATPGLSVTLSLEKKKNLGLDFYS